MIRFTEARRDRIHAVFAWLGRETGHNVVLKPAQIGRRGLTLFEVVLSLGIFLGALAAVGQLISTGSRAAVQSQLRSKAILRCESKLAEVLASAETMQTVDEMPFEDDEPGWTWSLQVAEGPHADLLELEVVVMHTGQNRLGDVSYSLRRYVRNPQLFLDAAIDESVESEE